MIDQQIDIATKDGKTTTFITHPERGGPFPVIIFYMDAPAIREELRDMARRLSSNGRNAIYSREEILRWLKIDVPNP